MRPILITIAGGTASGKSTVVKEIIKQHNLNLEEESLPPYKVTE